MFASFEGGGRCILAAVDLEHLQIGDRDASAAGESLCGTGGVAVVVKCDAGRWAFDRLFSVGLAWSDVLYDDSQSSRGALDAYSAVREHQLIEKLRDRLAELLQRAGQVVSRQLFGADL